MLLHGVFFIVAIATGLTALRMWRLFSTHRFPGGDWWTAGIAGVSLSCLLVTLSPVIGSWGHTLAAHVAVIGGFCAQWIGTRLFFGGRQSRLAFPLFVIFVAGITWTYAWYALAAPDYAIRLAINCIFLILFSLGIAMTLFATRILSSLVIITGVLYMLFAVINTFRAISVILSPDTESFFLANAVGRNLAVAMLPVILGAVVCLEYMAGEYLAGSGEKDG